MIFNCGWCKKEIDYMWLTREGLCPECAEKSLAQDRQLQKQIDDKKAMREASRIRR